jgi:hypothetical protein
MLFMHLGIEFDEELQLQGPAPDFGMTSWNEQKQSLGIPLVGLPWIIDDEVKIKESLAILRHVSRKYKPEYLGRTLVESAEAD